MALICIGKWQATILAVLMISVTGVFAPFEVFSFENDCTGDRYFERRFVSGFSA